MLNTSPAFNLKVVLKETGITADTLRAWERRYGLPMPHRTEGGHRLYSERDIEIIKWLMAQQASGLSISRAVDRYNELLASGSDPLADARPASARAFRQATSEATNLDRLREEWLNACLTFNESQAEQILNHAFALHPVETVIETLIQRGLHEIGKMWYGGKVSVQQEHFASGLAMRRLEALIAASPAPTRRGTILLACPPNEWHTLPLVMLHLFLRRRGFNAVYLGANVPIARFEETAKLTRSQAAILTSQTLIGAASLQKTAAALSKKMTVGFGGRIFNLQPEIAKSIAGHYLGSDMAEAVNKIENLIGGNIKKTRVIPAPKDHLEAHELFVAKRAEIEQTARTAIKSMFTLNEEIQTGIHFLSDNIAAALQLGNLNYVSDEMSWIKHLLHTHKRSGNELVGFMNAYAKAVDKHINGSRKPILAWLKQEIKKIETR